MADADGALWYPATPEDAATLAITYGCGFVHDMDATPRGEEFKADTLLAMTLILGGDS
jgi:hypothetical protein